jgi:hypothetical protein
VVDESGVPVKQGGVLMLRQEPATVEVEGQDETELVRHVTVREFWGYDLADEVAERYEQALREEGLPFDECTWLDVDSGVIDACIPQARCLQRAASDLRRHPAILMQALQNEGSGVQVGERQAGERQRSLTKAEMIPARP